MGESLPRARLVVERCPKPGQTGEISREEAAHARARRLAPGDSVTLIDGTGIEARGRLLELTRSGGRVAVEEVSRADPAAPELGLLVAGLRPERLSWIAEKATELGASRLVLVSTRRTQSFRAGAAAIERLSRVVREAAKQCESARWPRIEGPLALDLVLAAEHARQRLLLDLDGGPFPARLSGSVAILVGPEGGWTQSERAAAGRAWSPVALPAGKLRAETAAVAALVLARAALARAPRR